MSDIIIFLIVFVCGFMAGIFGINKVIDESYLNKAAILCNTNGGIKNLEIGPTYKVVCKNTAEFKID